jgi:hypothetical protein
MMGRSRCCQVLPMLIPDYQGGGIANLMASISLGLGGGATGYPAAPLVPPETLAGTDKLVLLVLDGLGYDRLRDTPQARLLNRGLLGPLTSVCPPTTASAIPTFLTGRPPQQHGFTGWFTWFGELGALAAVLPFQHRCGGGSLAGAISPRALCGLPPLFDGLGRPAHLVMPEWIADSPFNRAFLGNAGSWPYRGLAGLVSALGAALRADAGPAYVYAYWPGYDAIAHRFGAASPEARRHLLELDRAVAAVLGLLEDRRARLLVTADHGFIDSPPERTLLLADHPRLAETLLLPLSGEPRLAYCYVQPDRRGAFESYVRERLGAYCDLYPSAALIEQGWFGLGAPHPRLADRLGHYALVMRENYKIKDWLPGEEPYVHLGVHGGMSREELLVPLLLFETEGAGAGV